MKLMEALSTRRAVREFTPDRVSAGIVDELIAAAVQAPSYMNLQPWVFAATVDPVLVSGLGREARRHLLASMNSLSPFFAEREQIGAPDFDIFYKAPALIVVCATSADPMARFGCTMAAYNIMLAAQSMGLGSCWVSQAQPWFDTAEGKRALGIEAGHTPVAPIIVGCPAGAPLSPGRFEPRTIWIGKNG